MNCTRVDHVGIAVKDLAASVKWYEETLGLHSKGTEVVQEQQVTVAFLPCGDSELELLESMIPPAPPHSTLTPVDASAYGELRERLLSGTFHARYGGKLLEFQAGASRLSGAGLYRLVIDGKEGCAAAEYTNGSSLAIKELLLPPSLMTGGVSLIKEALQADRYFVRTPTLWDGLPGSYIQPFAMVKWLREDLRQVWGEERSGYFGLGFD